MSSAPAVWVIWSFWAWTAQTVLMARKKHAPPGPITKAARQARAQREVQPYFPQLSAQDVHELADPVRQTDALKALMEAMKAAGIDPASIGKQAAARGSEWVSLITARTDHSEQLALAVEHTDDVRKLAASKPRTAQQGHAQDDQLRSKVKATLYLRRGLHPEGGPKDDRQPVLMDGEIICLAGPDDDTRADLITLRLPRVVVERLRDAVHALAPQRTMAGIASLGISMVLDVLEAAYIRHRGHRFPKRPSEALQGGRPSRLRAVAPPARRDAAKARKQARKTS